MPYEIEPVHVEQGGIVREFFVNTADDNYITARWCFVENLHIDYFWLAVHALEKYMKAILLLNGASGIGYRDKTSGECKEFRHNIVILYERVKCLASDLLPNDLKKPNNLDTDRWIDESPEAFLRRLYRNGNPSNRYQVFGLYRRNEDLFKLDLMIYALRRLCVPLDAYFMGKRRSGSKNWTHLDVLKRQPEHWSISQISNLEKTIAGKRGKTVQHVLLNLNLRFAPEDYAHESLQTGVAARNSVLARSVLRPLEQEPHSQRAALAAEVCDWIIERVYLPTDVKKQLSDAKAKWESMSHFDNGA